MASSKRAADETEALHPQVQALLKAMRTKQSIGLTAAGMAEWTATLAAIPASEREVCATHLLAAGAKLLRLAKKSAEPAVKQLVTLAGGLMTKKSAKSGWAR